MKNHWWQHRLFWPLCAFVATLILAGMILLATAPHTGKSAAPQREQPPLTWTSSPVKGERAAPSSLSLGRGRMGKSTPASKNPYCTQMGVAGCRGAGNCLSSGDQQGGGAKSGRICCR